jgi:trimeric autotransporter adhesin
MKSRLPRVLVGGFALALLACDTTGGGGSDAADTSPRGWVATAAATVIAPGSVDQLTATAFYDTISPQDITASVEWSSVDLAVATVSASGLVTAVAPGTATITGIAPFGGDATVTVTVAQP